MIKVCVLISSFEDSETPIQEYDTYYDPAYYLDGYHCETHFIKKASAERQIEALVQRNDVDVFLNLCDGEPDEDLAGVEVVQALERFGVAFTGPASDFYSPTRQRMKEVCRQVGVKTPAGVFVGDTADGLDGSAAGRPAAQLLDEDRGGERELLERLTAGLRYPLIIKHPNSYASIGMKRESRVETFEQLSAQTARMVREFGGALIEEFIEGREFTVLVVENPEDGRQPVAYPPLECCFPSGETFKHFDLKWVNYQDLRWVPCQEPELEERLKEISCRVFTGMQGSSYARCDIRMDCSGELYLLEINPGCGVFYPPGVEASADMILRNHPEGHRGFADLIIRSALKRRKPDRRPQKI